MAGPAGPDLAAGLSRLANVVLSEETVDTVLELVADVAAWTLAHADAAVAALARAGEPQPRVAASSEEAAVIDRLQYEVGRGPGVEALRDGRRSNVALTPSGASWPELAVAAAERGFRSLLTVPLRGQGRTIAVLSLYSKKDGAFGEPDVVAAETFAGHAAALVNNALLLEARYLTNEQLQAALDTRGLIGEAQGILMVRHGCGSGEAFAILRRASQAANRKLSDVAREVVESQGRGGAAR